MADVVTADDSRAPGPRVRIPPPILFAAGFVLGVLMSRRWPVNAPWGHVAWVRNAGLPLVGCGLVLVATGIITFRRARTSVLPHHPARVLVTSGIYRFTRNPIYVGMTIAYLGGVLATGAMWALVLLPLVLLLLFALVIRAEERYLRERFPVEYADYWRRVRRWI